MPKVMPYVRSGPVWRKTKATEGVMEQLVLETDRLVRKLSAVLEENMHAVANGNRRDDKKVESTAVPRSLYIPCNCAQSPQGCGWSDHPGKVWTPPHVVSSGNGRNGLGRTSSSETAESTTGGKTVPVKNVVTVSRRQLLPAGPVSDEALRRETVSKMNDYVKNAVSEQTGKPVAVAALQGSAQEKVIVLPKVPVTKARFGMAKVRDPMLARVRDGMIAAPETGRLLNVRDNYKNTDYPGVLTEGETPVTTGTCDLDAISVLVHERMMFCDIGGTGDTSIESDEAAAEPIPVPLNEGIREMRINHCFLSEVTNKNSEADKAQSDGTVLAKIHNVNADFCEGCDDDMPFTLQVIDRGEAPHGGKNVKFGKMRINVESTKLGEPTVVNGQETVAGPKSVPHVTEVDVPYPRSSMWAREVSKVGISSAVPLEGRNENDMSSIYDACAVTDSNSEREAAMLRSCQTDVVTDSNQTIVILDVTRDQSGDVSLVSEAHIQTVLDDLTEQYSCKQEADLTLATQSLGTIAKGLAVVIESPKKAAEGSKEETLEKTSELKGLPPGVMGKGKDSMKTQKSIVDLNHGLEESLGGNPTECLRKNGGTPTTAVTPKQSEEQLDQKAQERGAANKLVRKTKKTTSMRVLSPPMGWLS